MSKPGEGQPVSETRQAWQDLVGALSEIDADWIGPQRGLAPGREHLGIRGLAMALWGALDLYLENEPERPHFVRLISPYRKWGDNPDAIYFFAPLRGDLTYRVQGRRGREVYLERTVSLNDAQMEMGEDRRYRVVIAHRDPGVPNWLDTCGEPRAAVFWRFMLPAEPPDAPVCSVMPVDRVAETP